MEKAKFIKKLPTNSPLIKRGKYKKLSIKEREKDHLVQAEKMFLNIIKWDTAINTYEDNIFDQLIRTYSMQLNISKNIEQKQNLLRKIIKTLKTTEELQNEGLLLKD